MPKIFIETNFSFPNLVRKYKKLEKKANTDIHKAAAKTAKQIIKSGSLRPLRQSTIDLRKRDGIQGTKPLHATGRLLKSIKGDSKGFHIIEYGKKHNDGFTTSTSSKFIKNFRGKKIAPRPFIEFDEETQNKFTEEFIEGIHEALKK